MTTIFDPNQTPTVSIGYQNIPNILDNGGFEIWQRGTTFVNPTASAYTTDRWQFTYAGTAPVVTVSQESTIVDSGNFSCKLLYTSVSGTSFTQFGQPVENYKAYAGKTITLSMRVWSNVAGSSLELASAAGNFASSSAHPGDSAWHTLSVTYNVVANPSFLLVYFNPVLAAGTHYIDSAMLIIGNQPVSFVPTHPAVDFERCQRYYEVGTLDMLHPVWSNANNSLTSYYMRDFRVIKAYAPTVTVTKPSPTIFLDNLSPNSTGGTSGSYTPDTSSSWSASSGAVTTGGFQCTMSRASATPSVSNLIESGPTWTASADL